LLDKAVASFFKPASQKEPERLVWRTVDNTLIVGRYNASIPSSQQRTLPVKIAAFDLDDTIIAPNAGKTWNRSPTSWKWWDASVPGKLKSLHDEGYIVIILSNQSNISLKDNKKSLQKDMASLTNFKSQLRSILTQLDLPISVYAATGQDKYRKPRVGMWDEALGDYDLQTEGAVDMANSFYIGDAAGREKAAKRRKDHATSDRYSSRWIVGLYVLTADRELAANIGVTFRTPEEYFLGEATESYDHAFEPGRHLPSVETVEPTSNEIQNHTISAPFTRSNPQELVVFCGSPGAGKSTFYWGTFHFHSVEPQPECVHNLLVPF
jgi:bifunctional polynucleotide phosphatase/kinase